jgi:hypothetical protein
MSGNYDLSNTILPYCQGIWNKQDDEYVDAPSINVINCCLQLNKPSIEYCYSQCESKFGGAHAQFEDIPARQRDVNSDKELFFNCIKKCDQLVDNARSDCLNYKSRGLDIVNKCSQNVHCGVYPTTDKECVKNNRQLIVDCYNKVCLNDVDCNHADEFVQFISTDTPLLRLENRYNQLYNDEDFSRAPRYYIYISLLVVTIIAVIVTIRN